MTRTTQNAIEQYMRDNYKTGHINWFREDCTMRGVTYSDEDAYSVVVNGQNFAVYRQIEGKHVDENGKIVEQGRKLVDA